jgi:arylsulfatase A-like enzyme
MLRDPLVSSAKDRLSSRVRHGTRAGALLVLCLGLVIWPTPEAAAGWGWSTKEQNWTRADVDHSLREIGRRHCRHGHCWEARREAFRKRRVEQWCRTKTRSESPMRTRALQRRAPKPNIVLVMTDDQRADSLEYMPVVMDRMVDEGVSFNNSFVTTPLCGPSRASVLTGRYAHNHHVIDNNALLFDASSTIATQLQAAGYRTGLIGKYMNLYLLMAPEIPPGWDTWRAFYWGGYYDYTLFEDGVAVEYGSDPEDYSTDVLREMAVEFIDENHKQPFFLVITPWAPHVVAAGAPRHEGAYATLPPWRPESFYEEDISDKPGFISWIERLRTRGGIEALLERIESRDASHIRELESLLAVDEAVEAVIERLERYRIDQDTLIIFTSDNGLHWGEHWLGGKYNAYEESIRVPMVIRYPRMVAPAQVEERMVLNIDLAPTLAELAGVSEPDPMDGESLAGILCGHPQEWREDFLLEYFLVRGFDGMPRYSGVRSEKWKYLIYLSGFEELYDLENDPAEMDNLLQTEPDDEDLRALADELFARLIEFKTQ